MFEYDFFVNGILSQRLFVELFCQTINEELFI